MAALLHGDPSRLGVNEGGAYMVVQDKIEEGGGRWYFTRKEIEEDSPSRRDGIDLKKETYLRKSYCTFLQDLGMRLKVPQVTIATAIIFCHRFFHRQSHGKNDRRTVATVCMFLAGKVEETPRPLKDVILVSYEIIHKKDPAAIQRIKQKEVYEQQKELILVAERIVLATLAFDMNVLHPYKPLVEAIKKFKVAQNALAQVAWNFVNDGLRTSLCLQFKPHHIAAGAIFLAAKFLKVKLPSEGEKVWWQEFDVNPRQLEEVSNQMLELYEQNRVPASQASEAEGSAGGAQRPPMKAPASMEEHASSNGSNPQGGGASSKIGSLKPASTRLYPNQSDGDNHVPQASQSRYDENGSTDLRNDNPDRDRDVDVKDRQEGKMLTHQENVGEIQAKSRLGADAESEEDHAGAGGKIEKRDAGELKDKYHGRTLEYKDGTLGKSPQDAIKKLDKDKLKAAIEKRRKSRGDTKKTGFLDEDDLIERELEDGIEMAESEKTKQERRQNLSPGPEQENAHHNPAKEGMKEQLLHGEDSDIVEDGEVKPFVSGDGEHASPKASNRKRRAASSLDDELAEGKQQLDYVTASQPYNHHDFPEDRNRLSSRHGYSDREHKRQIQENHV